MNIGDKHLGYKIIAKTAYRYVLGYNPEAFAPYVIWYLDSHGKPCAGSYFWERKDAIAVFSTKGFGCYD